MRSDTTNHQQLRYEYGEFSSALGKRVKQLRKEKGITLRALIVEHGFHLTQIHRIEKGSGISVQMLLRIAEVFQVPLETLIAGLGRMVEKEDTPPVKAQTASAKRPRVKPKSA